RDDCWPGVGDRKPEVEPFVQRFRLVDDTPRVRPGVGLIRVLGQQPYLLPRLGPLLLGLLRQWRRQRFQPLVADQADRVGDALLLAVVVERRDGEAGIRPQLDAHLGPARPQVPDQTLQDGDGPPAGWTAASARIPSL